MPSAELRGGSVITDPRAATPEWLTRTLVEAGAAPEGARVLAVERTELSAGRLGRCVRFGLTWAGVNSSEMPAAVVGKFASMGAYARQTGLISNGYAGELAFYRHLAGRVLIPVPRCYLAKSAGGTSGDFVILMSCLDGASPRDQATGASVRDIGTAIDTVSRLHAQFWASNELGRQPWLPLRDAAARRRIAAIYHLLCTRFLHRFGDRLSQRAVAAVERFKPLVRKWSAIDEPPFTLLHGDYRLDNLLFSENQSGGQTVTVIDWQTIAVGPGPKDVAYLLGGSLPIEERRAHESSLLARYVRALRAHGAMVDRNNYERAHRLGTLAGLHMTVVGAMLVGANEPAEEMFLAMAERHSAHAADHDALSHLDSYR